MVDKEDKAGDWSLDRAREYYNVRGWGSGYFDINQAGHLVVTPFGSDGPTVDMLDVIDEISDKNLTLPCIVRFQDVLRSQVQRLIQTFQKEIKDINYRGQFFGVYPIKVNQMREVVEEVLDVGAHAHYGLEAGSKAELMAVLAYNTDPEALTICNGYKDDDYMRLSQMGRHMGRKVIVVIERLSELPRLLAVADEMGVDPMIGLRARLSTQGAGKWVSSSGDFAKFGLSIPEIIQAAQLLKGSGKEHCLKLFHFHAGSQITDIRIIKDAVNEGTRIYAKLRKMGFPVDYLDVGGGLGIDYEGAKTTSDSSVNYTVEEYIADIVYNIQQICLNEEVEEPHIVTESGRAVTAHHSCIIMNVFGNIHVGQNAGDVLPGGGESEIVLKMQEIVGRLQIKNLLETYHDASACKEESLAMFKLGILDLAARAKVESLYWHLCREILKLTPGQKRIPKEVRQLTNQLADQYLGNFSLFQSAPDHWAFGQLFPIMPLQRLEERPTREANIVDITCDSDGKVCQFIDPANPRKTLRLHELRPDQSYYIGMFLLGAYQDIMGDMHNLFGRVNEVHIFVDDEDPEDFYIEEVIPGDRVADVLGRVQYHPAEMIKMVKKTLDDQVKSGRLKPKQGVTLVEFYEKLMNSYTYLTIR